MKNILLGVLILIVLFVVLHVFSVRKKIRIGVEIAENAIAYTQVIEHSDLNILVAGDSAAVGTGVERPEESVAGFIGQDFPKANIQNIGINGLRTKGLKEEIAKVNQHFDLVVLQIGGNDILRFTLLDNLGADLSSMLDHTKIIGDNVVILTSGNVGTAPFFPRPFDLLWTWRTKKVRTLFQKITEEKGVTYIDLFAERENDPFLVDPERFYAADFLHPAGPGYALWYDKLKQTINLRELFTE